MQVKLSILSLWLIHWEFSCTHSSYTKTYKAECISNFKNDTNDINNLSAMSQSCLKLFSKSVLFCVQLMSKFSGETFSHYSFITIVINLLHSWMATKMQTFWIRSWLHFRNDSLKFHFSDFDERSEKYTAQLYFNLFLAQLLLSD